MFDIGWSEILLIAVLAIIFIGPKDIPVAMRALGRMLGKARAITREFQASIDEVMRESELDELRRQIEKAAEPVRLDDDTGIGPAIPPEKPRVASPPNPVAQETLKTPEPGAPPADAAPESPPPQDGGGQGFDHRG